MKTLDAEKKADKPAEAAPAAPAIEEKIDFSKVKIEPLFEDTVDFETFAKSDFRAVKVKDCVAVPKSKKLLKFTLDDGTGTDRTILSGIHAFYEPAELIGKTCIAIVNLPPRAMMGIESFGMLISAVHNEEGEEKLHLLGKFMETKKMVNEINELTKKYLENGDIDVIHEIERISNNIVENF